MQNANSAGHGAMAGMRIISLLLMLCALVAGFASAPAYANSKYASLVMDVDTGKVLYSRSPDAQRYPASLTKMMTLYMAFDAIKAGKLSLNQKIKISRHATKQPPSKLGLKRGSRIRFEDAILALVTKSANDIAVAVGESISGSEVKFASAMTRRAKQLGMKRTIFKNASGLPNRKQKTTARDMAILSRALMQDHKDFYHYFNRRSFKYAGRRYGNHNKLLSWYKGTDGIKTGYIRASGFNLAASVERDGRRLIGVVFGGRTGKRRDRHMAKILDKSFRAVKKDEAWLAKVSGKKLKATPVARLPLGLSKKDRMIQIAQAGRKTVETAAISKPSAKPVAKRQKMLIAAAPKKPVTKQPAAPRKNTQVSNADRAELRDIMKMLDEKATIAGNTPQPPRDTDSINVWGIQVGAYSQRLNANSQLIRVASSLGKLIAQADRNILQTSSHGRAIYRARFARMSHKQAVTACAKLRKISVCTLVPPGDSNVIAKTPQRQALHP